MAQRGVTNENAPKATTLKTLVPAVFADATYTYANPENDNRVALCGWGTEKTEDGVSKLNCCWSPKIKTLKFVEGPWGKNYSQRGLLTWLRINVELIARTAKTGNKRVAVVVYAGIGRDQDGTTVQQRVFDSGKEAKRLFKLNVASGTLDFDQNQPGKARAVDAALQEFHVQWLGASESSPALPATVCRNIPAHRHHFVAGPPDCNIAAADAPCCLAPTPGACEHALIKHTWRTASAVFNQAKYNGIGTLWTANMTRGEEHVFSFPANSAEGDKKMYLYVRVGILMTGKRERTKLWLAALRTHNGPNAQVVNSDKDPPPEKQKKQTADGSLKKLHGARYRSAVEFWLGKLNVEVTVQQTIANDNTTPESADDVEHAINAGEWAALASVSPFAASASFIFESAYQALHDAQPAVGDDGEELREEQLEVAAMAALLERWPALECVLDAAACHAAVETAKQSIRALAADSSALQAALDDGMIEKMVRELQYLPENEGIAEAKVGEADDSDEGELSLVDALERQVSYLVDAFAVQRAVDNLQGLSGEALLTDVVEIVARQGVFTKTMAEDYVTAALTNLVNNAQPAVTIQQWCNTVLQNVTGLAAPNVVSELGVAFDQLKRACEPLAGAAAADVAAEQPQPKPQQRVDSR